MTADCDLCGLPADPPVSDSAVDGTFCCRGCLEVSRSLDDAATVDDADDADRTAPDDADEAFVRVDGMHCATCETYVQGALADADGVFDAEASYPSGAAKVTYDAASVDDPAELAVPGYRVREFDADADDDDGTVGRLLVGGFFGMLVMMWYVLFLYPTYYGLGPAVDIIDLGVDDIPDRVSEQCVGGRLDLIKIRVTSDSGFAHVPSRRARMIVI